MLFSVFKTFYCVVSKNDDGICQIVSPMFLFLVDNIAAGDIESNTGEVQDKEGNLRHQRETFQSFSDETFTFSTVFDFISH